MTKLKTQSTKVALVEIRRRTGSTCSPEEKIRIVFEGLRSEPSVAADSAL